MKLIYSKFNYGAWSTWLVWMLVCSWYYFITLYIWILAVFTHVLLYLKMRNKNKNFESKTCTQLLFLLSVHVHMQTCNYLMNWRKQKLITILTRGKAEKVYRQNNEISELFSRSFRFPLPWHPSMNFLSPPLFALELFYVNFPLT